MQLATDQAGLASAGVDYLQSKQRPVSESRTAGPPPRADGNPVRCRVLGPEDFDAVTALLTRGFPGSTAAHWSRALRIMADRPSPPGVPRFGYVLDHGGELIGVLLTIFSEVTDPDGPHLRCNLSSWYVDPRFRGYGALLDTFAMRNRTITYFNTTPAPHTRPMHEARGFREHGGRLLLAIPALSRPRPNQTIEAFARGRDQGLSPQERALAVEHEAYGCLCFVSRDPSGASLVIFLRRSLPVSAKMPAARLPCWQLIYGPVSSRFGDWAGTIGRYLLRRHLMPLVLLDIEGPIPGVHGRTFGSNPRYVRGPRPAALGDLSSTEIALFGP